MEGRLVMQTVRYMVQTMKRALLLASLGMTACHAPSNASSASPPVTVAAQVASAQDLDVRIEQQLLANVQVRGEDTHFTLREQMNKYKGFSSRLRGRGLTARRASPEPSPCK